MNRNDDINLIAFLLKLVTRWIDYDVQKTFGNVKALHQPHALFHIGGHKGQPLFEARIPLARWPNHVLKQFVCWLARVSVEHHSAHQEAWTFGNVQTQSTRRFNHVVHVNFRVAVLSVKNFQKKGQIVCARRA